MLFIGGRVSEKARAGVSGVGYREEELRQAFFSSRFSRTLDALGYARFRRWRVYCE